VKKRFSIIFTITAAAVLVSSIAYASKKKLRAKSEPRIPDMSEIDLSAHLLDSSAGSKPKTLKVGDSVKRSEDELNDLIIACKPRPSDKATGR
jgi:hypothetical protein